MTSDEDQPTQAEREAALFGPPGRGEYRRGDTLRFKDPQSGEHQPRQSRAARYTQRCIWSTSRGNTCSVRSTRLM